MNVHSAAWIVALVLIAMTAVADDDGTAPAPLSEWQIRNVWRIDFNGNESFSADNIRRALAINPATQATVAETIPRETFVTTVAEQIQAGYRQEGFREAKVSADFDADSHVVRATIIEGPRYTVEALPEIEGVNDPIRTAIRNALTTPRPAPKPNNPFATDSALWQEGAHEVPNEDSLKKIQQAIEQCLERHGYHFAEFKTQIEIDDGNRSIGLTVAVDQLNPPLKMSGIRLTGLERHSVEQVTEFLQIAPDAIVTAELHAHICRRLLDSGRFLVANSWNPAPFGAGHQVVLNIDVREYDGSPLLTEEFSESQMQLMRRAQWLNQWDEDGDDIRLSLDADLAAIMKQENSTDTKGDAAVESDSASTVTRAFLESLALGHLHSELIFSCSNGTQASLTVLNTDGKAVVDLVSSHSDTGLRLVSRHRQSIWHRDQQTGVPYATVRWVGIPLDPESKTSGTASFAMSFGFNSEPQNGPLVHFDVTPAAWLSTFRSDNVVVADGETPGSCRMEIDDAYLEFDRETGKVHAAELAMAPYRLRIRREPGAMLHELAKLDTETATWPNEFRQDRALSSAIAFAASECEELFHAGGIDAAPLLLRVLQDPDVFGTSAERAMSLFSEEWFTIPVAGQQLSSANWQFHLAMAVLPPGSTAHRLAAAGVAGQMTGDVSSLRHLLMEIDQDESHGPLDCLAAAFLVKELRPRMAHLGLDRFSRDAAIRDLQPLLSERSVLSDLLCGGIRFVRTLSAEEAELMMQAAEQLHTHSKQPNAEFTLPNAASLIVMIRSHPSEDPGEIVSSLLPLIWAAGLETTIRNGLIEYRDAGKPRSMFRTATQSTRTDKPQSPAAGSGGSRQQGDRGQEKQSGAPAVDIPDDIDSIYKPSLKILEPDSGSE